MPASTLPDNVDALKEIISELTAYKEKAEFLEEENKRLRHQIYGRKSEKLTEEDKQQSRLFDEVEHQVEELEETEAIETVDVKSHRRKKTGRKKFSDDLPRVDVIHDLPESEKTCACGAKLSKIGEEASEQLDIVPQKVEVHRHVRYKYACRSCEGTSDESQAAVKIAPLPKRIIHKCMVTAGFLAFVITGKFVDHLPFYRLEKIFDRMGIDIGRATMCSWAFQIYLRCNRLMKVMALEARKGPLVGIDETTIQVLKERGRSPTKKSFMWVLRGGTRDHPVILFRYRRGRSAKFLKRYLRGFKGKLQTDGYDSYNDVAAQLNITHAACWAHVRRKFHDLSKISKRKKVANIALKIIGELYAIEAEAKEQKLTGNELIKLRQAKSKAVVDRFRVFLDSKRDVTKSSPMGKAVQYALNQWPKLLVFLEDPNVPIDNNLVENAIRPFVLGRKNWLFNDTTKGARASSALYSLIETAKANDLEPYWYLRYLFENLPAAGTDEQLVKLLPNRIDKSKIRAKTTA